MPDVLPKDSENANKQPVTPASRLRTGSGARKASVAGGHAEPPDGYCRTPISVSLISSSTCPAGT
jgi:hypothetical protein